MKKHTLLTLCCAALSAVTSTVEAQNNSVRIAKYKGDKACAISYTFDDGMPEHYTLAAPKLEQQGFRGTFWINGSWINENGTTSRDTTHLDWAQCKEMVANGHEISNHGWAHRNLPKISTEEAIYEIKKNDSVIFEKLGYVPATFCYPFNARNEEIIEIASENRVGTRTHQFSLGSKATPENLEKRVNDLLESGEWGVAMTHGINYGYDAFNEPAIFWEHLKKVKALEDKIWVGTFREVAAYIKERETIQLQVTENRKGVTITPQLALDKNLFTELLTAVIERQKVKKATVSQGKKKLDTRILTDKVLFDFDPFGGPVQVELK